MDTSEQQVNCLSNTVTTDTVLVAPPTKMDRDQLTAEGYYGIYGRAGVYRDSRVFLVYGQPSSRQSDSDADVYA